MRALRSDPVGAQAVSWAREERLEDHVADRNLELEIQALELRVSMDELDAFAQRVAHDLRAPLRAMTGFADLLLEGDSQELGSDRVTYLGFIQQNARSMQRLVEGLLAFSRSGREALDLTNVSPTALARQALFDLGADGAQCNAVIDIREMPNCVADATLLKQVFVNLMSNAIKFSKDVAEAVIQVGSVDRDGSVVYFVSDTGIGFEPCYAATVFEEFKRLHGAGEYEGTGLGLASVKRIVERHGGRVWSESAVGKGATFYFTINAGEASE